MGEKLTMTIINIEEIFANTEKMMDEMNQEAMPKLGRYCHEKKTLKDWQWIRQKPPAGRYLFYAKKLFDVEAGFLPQGKACMIASPGGCGKTFLLIHCAIAAATGTDWLHTKAQGSHKVVFITPEEDEEDLWKRFYNMVHALGVQNRPDLMALLEKNIIVYPQSNDDPELIASDGKATDSYKDLKDLIEDDHNIKLVILDPATRFMGEDTETLNKAATRWVGLIEQLTKSGGKPTVLVAHHTNKTALRPVGNDKKPVFDQSMCRGASALVDGFRWVLGLQRSELEGAQRSIYIKLLKSNYSELGATLEFEQDYKNGGILKFVREVTVESLNSQKVSPAWDAARKVISHNTFIHAGD